MGQAAGSNSSLKESQILNMKQKDIMGNFRTGHCNLLVATSVLEEGIDIPECNLIVRFDKIRTYCDYVQTKGKDLLKAEKTLKNFNIISKNCRKGKMQESFLLHASKSQRNQTILGRYGALSRDRTAVGLHG